MHGQRAIIEAHAAGLPAGSPLRQLLASEAFEHDMSAYEGADRQAANSQRRYKDLGRLALTLTTFATLIAAVTLLPFSASFPRQVTGAISAFQSAANILTLMIVLWLNRSGAIGTWLTTRAEAERLRGKLFADLLAAPGNSSPSPPQLWSEKLELFNAAHFDYQRNWFVANAARHSDGGQGTSLLRWLAYGAIGLAVAIGVVNVLDLWPAELLARVSWLKFSEEPVRWQLGLNTFASSLLAYASARMLMNQDERNAALYAHSGRRLDELKAAEGEEVALAARAGDGDRVLRYARAVQSILDADHQAWQHHRPLADPTNGPPPSVNL